MYLVSFLSKRFRLHQTFTMLRARRNEKDLKVKPATSFKYFQYLLTKIKTKFKAEKI